MILLLVLECEFLPGLNYIKISCLFKLFQNRSLRKTSRTLACAEPSCLGSTLFHYAWHIDLPVAGFFFPFLERGVYFFPSSLFSLLPPLFP
uniref:Uncharacterized protein n=1 Tax=Prolemur simus TaxID=1328070 RepID=A0A8C8YLR8_PROSS